MKRHYLTNQLSLATLLLLLATSMPSFAQDADPADEPTAPESCQPTLPKNDDGFYVIASDLDYETFREIVASGNPYANAVLATDIMVRNPIGSGEEHVHYRGTFDGQGHTVKMWGDEEDRDTYSYSGLFDNTKPGCIIRNLHVTGNVAYNYSVSKSTHLGSIVNDATGTVIENCISDATVLAGSIKRGGLVGIARGECMIENSAFIGGLQVGAEQRCGLVGENSQALSLKSCYVAPEFGQYSKNFSEPTIVTDNVDISLNNYYTYRYVDKSYGNNIDKVPLELPDYATEVEDADLSSGKLCYMLNKNGRNGVVWYQNGKYPYPFQTGSGVLVTSRDNGETFAKGETCEHKTNSDVCPYCGAIMAKDYVEPLQNSGLSGSRNFYVDNIIYEPNSASMSVSVVAIRESADSQDADAPGVKAVHIPESIHAKDASGYIHELAVTSIAENAFKDNSALEYCFIPKTVTSIRANAFSGCTNLKYVHIADGDYSADKETAKAKALGFDDNVFGGCASLEKVYVGRDMKWTKGNGGPFATNGNIKEIYWGANVSRVGNLTEGAESTQFAIGGENINRVFFLGSDKSLASEVEVCSYSTMSHCKDFYINRNVVGNYFTTENNGGGLFDGCETAVFGPFVKTIAAKAFKGTEASPKPLKIADISTAYNLETVGDDAFFCCANLTNSFPFNITKLSSLGRLAFAGSGITGVAFGNYLTEIPEAAFLGCNNLGGAYIPASIETIGSAAFSACGLNRVIIEDSDKELDLTKQQFNGCIHINNVYLGRDIKLNEINDNTFVPQPGTIWTIGGKVTKLPEYLFHYDKYDGISFLYSEVPLHFSDYANITAKVITLDRALVCDKDNKEALPFPKSKNGQVESINIGGNITRIPANMFEGCSKVRNLVLPDNIIEIGAGAFKGCGSLNVVCIMGEASLGESAFEGCYSMQYLYLMGNTIALADNAFKGCKNIKEVIPIFTKDPGTGSSAIAFENDVYNNTKLCVDKHVVFNTDPWQKFQKKELTITTDVYTGSLYDGRGSYDRAYTTHELPKGYFDLIYLPFDMDSYYFGIDAEIYRMEEAGTSGGYVNVKDDFTEGAGKKAFDVDNIFFKRIDLDNEKTLTKHNVYLLKSNYDENTLAAYYSLFDSEKIELETNNKRWASEKDNRTKIAAQYIDGVFERYPDVFVADEGVMKFYNGGDFKLASVSDVVFFRSKRSIDDELTPIAYNLMSDKSVILSSKIDVPFKAMLDGYASFYASSYNYIAPEWCDVYIVTSADGESVTLEKIEDRTITKGQAVLLKSNNDEKLANDLTEHLTYATSGSEYSYAGNLLKGVDVETPVSDLGREFVYVLSKTEGNGTGFYKYDKPLQAGKAYLDPESLSPQQLAKSCLLTFNDIVTDIKPVQTTNRTQGIYDLMGRRLQDAGFKGICIVNGKKVVIK